jgi:hypothetical protein
MIASSELGCVSLKPLDLRACRDTNRTMTMVLKEGSSTGLLVLLCATLLCMQQVTLATGRCNQQEWD